MQFISVKYKSKVIFLSFIFNWLLGSLLFAQQKVVSYNIINKGDTIGQMQISRRNAKEDIYYAVSSVIETRMLMNIKVKVLEEAHYHNGNLVASSSKRFVNDKPRANKQTKAGDGFYIVTDDKKEGKLIEKFIHYDFSMLYFKEPLDVAEVYSNYYQKKINIQKLQNHSYGIDLPEGGFNTYYYVNGVCKKADLHSTLFNAQMVLNP